MWMALCLYMRTEIRIDNEDDVREFIVQAVRMALLNPNALNVTKYTKSQASIDKLNTQSKPTNESSITLILLSNINAQAIHQLL